MLFAVDRINNDRSILPGIKIGVQKVNINTRKHCTKQLIFKITVIFTPVHYSKNKQLSLSR
jgi:hypothetical protein